MDKVKLSELLTDARLGEYKEAILEYAKPCIRLHASLIDETSTVAVGKSHIGGLPDLPPNVAWPMRNGRPCEFIAQINLKDATPFDEEHLLPREGILLFFFDGRFYEDVEISPYQLGSETIIYYDGDMTLLERADFPESLEEYWRYRTCSITFEVDWMLPTWFSVARSKLEETVFDFHHDTSGSNDIPTIVETYRQLAESRVPYNDYDKHHMFGYPEPIFQNDPLFEASREQNGGEMDGYEILGDLMLLLQISSDDLPNMMWGDISSLYYSIRKQDLITKQFAHAICEVQY